MLTEKSSSVRKIAITGPESTGKSDLARKLAAHYKTVFVPEFARSYIEQLNRPYNEDDILLIAKKQLQTEKEAIAKADHYLFCDTELIVTRIWSLHRYGRCNPWIDQQIQKNSYDLFLLCNIDLPWEYDPQREHPDMRQYFMDWYIRELEAFGFPYHIVSGQGQNRVSSAIKAIDQYFSSHD